MIIIYKKEKKGDVIMKELGCVLQVLIIVIVLLLNFLLGGLATEYSIEYWGSLVKESTIQLPYLPTRIGGIFLGEITIPVAICTWIVSYMIENPYYESKDVKVEKIN
jgi:hypothetical protein